MTGGAHSTHAVLILKAQCSSSSTLHTACTMDHHGALPLCSGTEGECQHHTGALNPATLTWGCCGHVIDWDEALLGGAPTPCSQHHPPHHRTPRTALEGHLEGRLEGRLCDEAAPMLGRISRPTHTALPRCTPRYPACLPTMRCPRLPCRTPTQAVPPQPLT